MKTLICRLKFSICRALQGRELFLFIYLFILQAYFRLDKLLIAFRAQDTLYVVLNKQAFEECSSEKYLIEIICYF